VITTAPSRDSVPRTGGSRSGETESSPMTND
jgi:hypothetical protein